MIRPVRHHAAIIKTTIPTPPAMHPPLFRRLIAPLALAVLVSSCGSYQHVSSAASGRPIPATKDTGALSGKPALRLPARIGVVCSGRSRAAGFDEAGLAVLRQPGVAEVIPATAYLPGDGIHTIADFMPQRARVVEALRFLDLDLVLFYDESTQVEDRDHVPPLECISLGLIHPQSRTVRASSDAVLMDARTGFLYGALGEAGKGSSHTLTALEAESLGTFAENRARDEARRKALARFPGFWDQVRRNHGRRS